MKKEISEMIVVDTGESVINGFGMEVRLVKCLCPKCNNEIKGTTKNVCNHCGINVKFPDDYQ